MGGGDVPHPVVQVVPMFLAMALDAKGLVVTGHGRFGVVVAALAALAVVLGLLPFRWSRATAVAAAADLVFNLLIGAANVLV